MDIEERVRKQLLFNSSLRVDLMTGGELAEAVDKILDRMPQSEFLSLVSSAVESRLYELKED